MPPTPDPRLAPWKEAFRCGDIHPYMPPQATLIEMEGKLEGAAGFLRSLDPGDRQQADLGVKIGALVARYADKIMENFGWDDDRSTPLPANLTLARTLVENLLADVRQRIRDGWLANAADDGQDEINDVKLDEILAAGGATPVSPTAGLTASSASVTGEGQADEFRVDPDQHAVIQGGKVVRLGPTLEFKLIELLAGRRGKACSHDLLRDKVWEDDQTSSDAIYQVVKSLKASLKKGNIIGIEIKAGGGFYTLMKS